LSGRAPDASADTGPTVCACFGVGRNQICAAVASGKANSAEDIGAQLKAGTNCGSCLPEVRRLVAETAKAKRPVGV
jgi:assimilatory nitrate reductase catalytic subunit